MGNPKLEAIRIAKDFKEKAKEKYGIQKVIVFGSQVTGRARAGSDIDLLVVSDSFKKKAESMSKLLAEWHLNQKKKIPVDFICFTRKEFDELARKATIVKQALEEGVEI